MTTENFHPNPESASSADAHSGEIGSAKGLDPALQLPLFCVDMQWGLQPVRLTAWRCATLPTDAPTTSVHIVAYHGGRVLVVRDRKGVYGFPGGRLEAGETLDDALVREVYEEAHGILNPDYTLFGVLRIECTTQIPGRNYPHPYSYMAMYAGTVRSLDPIGRDPAGIIMARALFTRDDCRRFLDEHDKILLHESLLALRTQPTCQRRVRAFLGTAEGEPICLDGILPPIR